MAAIRCFPMHRYSKKNGPNNWPARARTALAAGIWGLGSALVASLCCAPPAVAFALGLGGSAFLVGLGRYQPYFVLGGLAIIALVGWRLLRFSDRCGRTDRRARLSRLALLLTVFGTGYVTINYLLLPWLYTLG